jgi:hypothetical protein
MHAHHGLEEPAVRHLLGLCPKGAGLDRKIERLTHLVLTVGVDIRQDHVDIGPCKRLTRRCHDRTIQ